METCQDLLPFTSSKISYIKKNVVKNFVLKLAFGEFIKQKDPDEEHVTYTR